MVFLLLLLLSSSLSFRLWQKSVILLFKSNVLSHSQQPLFDLLNEWKDLQVIHFLLLVALGSCSFVPWVCVKVSLSSSVLFSHIFSRIKGKIVCKHNFKKIAIRINIKGHNFLYIMLSCQVLSIPLLYFYLLSIQYKKARKGRMHEWDDKEKKSSKLISNRITHFSDAIEISLFRKCIGWS